MVTWLGLVDRQYRMAKFWKYFYIFKIESTRFVVWLYEKKAVAKADTKAFPLEQQEERNGYSQERLQEEQVWEVLSGTQFYKH